jgi:hypothetical protein
VERTLTGRHGSSPIRRAITGIERGEWDFNVERPAGDRVRVVVALSAYGNK